MLRSASLTTAQLAEIDRRLRDGVTASRIARDLGVSRTGLLGLIARSGYRTEDVGGVRQLLQAVPADVPAQPFAALQAA